MKLIPGEFGPIVFLSPEDRKRADDLGHWKHDKSEAEGRRADWYDGTERHNHADGVAGEMVVSFFLGVPFEFRVDNFKGADVGKNYEIRTTKSDWYVVKVKARDKDERIVVALRKRSEMSFEILGWLTVAEAKQFGELRDPGDRGKPAYFVMQQERLHPIEALPRE
jgi:hypothetical protein